MQAWKGDVRTSDNRTFTVTNRCYNGQLYPCQCLELGYLVRHSPGYNPASTFALNDVTAPPCSEEPACSVVKTTTSSTVTSGSSSTTGSSASSANHSCVISSPCHPDALCTVTGLTLTLTMSNWHITTRNILNSYNSDDI